MKKKGIVLLLFSIFLYQLKGQEIISTAGNFDTGATKNVSWTMGEIAVETLQSDQVVLTQGFQQSKIIITKVEKSKKPDFKLNLYPNPTENDLIIEIFDKPEANLKGYLYTTEGELIKYVKIESKITTLNLENLVNGMYILKICNAKNQTLVIYNIVKQ